MGMQARQYAPVIMDRVYIRRPPGPGEARRFLPVGWLCPICMTYRND
jgi:hypothetical protein